MQSPTPEEILAARQANGQTQGQAAAVIHKSWKSWNYWEAGSRNMDPAFWELYLVKTGRK